MDLGDDKWTKASCIKSCGIRISNHNFISNCVVTKVLTSVLTQVVAIDECLTALANQVVVSQYGNRKEHITSKDECSW
jgi:hypothetical protein